jgi:polyketide cyclase/dehydrase/lipid transport protein
MEADPTIRWPDEHRPEVSEFLAVNELLMDAEPQDVFAWLCRPDLWSSFYPNARLVKHKGGPWPRIELSSRWRWLTFGALITSELVEYDPSERLAWSARALGSRGHHAWLLRRQEGGTFVHTAETQRGWGIAVVKPVLRPMMVRMHQRWLEGLAGVAAKGPPPPP